ncbi:hypothetical protein [Salinimicrobium sp. GXAS 041]|uniref:hypothetical protein n=1 Tax=Salinimicrobium sp. GXAS 041 TaxID=3400806 RepID=UPI003C70AC55
MNKIKLTAYDKSIQFNDTKVFLNLMLKQSSKILIFSAGYVLILILIDSIARVLLEHLKSSYFEPFNQIHLLIEIINKKFGLKFIDFFKDVIVISAGVLGVIFGLFYTSFLNIITTKYANMHFNISLKMMEQKTIKRYFSLLAIMVISSILFQLTLVFGFNPTFISASLFTFTVLLCISSFIYFGRLSMIFFNESVLVQEILDEAYKILNRTYTNRQIFYSNKSNYALSSIKSKLELIKLIIEESALTSYRNTSLDEMSKGLLNFSLFYYRLKQTFPSNKKWHVQIYRHKTWEEASSSEYQVFSKSSRSLFPETIEDFNHIDKLVIQNQFMLFNLIKDDNAKWKVLSEQAKFVQTFSYQMDIDLFNSYFENLYAFLKDNLKSNENEDNISHNLQLVTNFSNLLINYFIGLNYNSGNLIISKNVNDLSLKIHSFQNFENVTSIPYKLRIWIDNHQSRLNNEKELLGKIVTPLSYTSNILNLKFAEIIVEHFSLLIDKTIDIVKDIQALLLKDKKYEIQCLSFLLDSLDIENKLKHGIDVSSNAILILTEKEIFEKFNTQKFKKDDFRNKIENLNEDLIQSIWEIGYISADTEIKNFPDLFGTVYNILVNDIIEIATSRSPDQLYVFTKSFIRYNFLYINKLDRKINTENIQYLGAKIYPLIIDLFEVWSFAFFVLRAEKRNDLNNKLLDYWDELFTQLKINESGYWLKLMAIYNYFQHSLMGLGNSSYVREFERKRKFEAYMKEKNFIKMKMVKHHHFPSKEFYSEINDYYLETIAKSFDDHFGFKGNLDQFFIEYFLRTRTVLKEAKIKETEYGKTLRRIVERN